MNTQIKVYAERHVSLCNLSLVATLIMRMKNVATYRIWETSLRIRTVSSELSVISNIEYGTMDLCF